MDVITTYEQHSPKNSKEDKSFKLLKVQVAKKVSDDKIKSKELAQKMMTTPEQIIEPAL